jgi:hypothetical protein
MRALLSLLLLVSVTAVPACSGNEGTAKTQKPADAPRVSEDVSASDGATIDASGAVLTIQPGALAADTTITVTVSDKNGQPMADSIAAKIFDFGPTGTTFTVPVELTIDFQGPVPANEKAVIAFLDNGAWTPLDDSVVSDSTVTAHTTHFTPYTVLFVNANQGTGLCNGPFDACGGDLTGTWSPDVACANFVPTDAPIQNCPGSVVSITVTPAGTVTFDPVNKTLTTEGFALTLTYSGTFPASCAPGGDCTTATVPSGTTATQSGLSCELSGSSEFNPSNDTSTLIVSGSEFQTQNPTDPMPSSPWRFCVMGDRFEAEGQVGDNGSTIVFSAKKL